MKLIPSLTIAAVVFATTVLFAAPMPHPAKALRPGKTHNIENDFILAYITPPDIEPSATEKYIANLSSSQNISINSAALNLICQSTSASIPLQQFQRGRKNKKNEYKSPALPLQENDFKYPISANIQIEYTYQGNHQKCIIQLTN